MIQTGVTDLFYFVGAALLEMGQCRLNELILWKVKFIFNFSLGKQDCLRRQSYVRFLVVLFATLKRVPEAFLALIS